jgi:hypothetical protein
MVAIAGGVDARSFRDAWGRHMAGLAGCGANWGLTVEERSVICWRGGNHCDCRLPGNVMAEAVRRNLGNLGFMGSGKGWCKMHHPYTRGM